MFINQACAHSMNLVYQNCFTKVCMCTSFSNSNSPNRAVLLLYRCHSMRPNNQYLRACATGVCWRGTLGVGYKGARLVKWALLAIFYFRTGTTLASLLLLVWYTLFHTRSHTTSRSHFLPNSRPNLIRYSASISKALVGYQDWNISSLVI